MTDRLTDMVEVISKISSARPSREVADTWFADEKCSRPLPVWEKCRRSPSIDRIFLGRDSGTLTTVAEKIWPSRKVADTRFADGKYSWPLSVWEKVPIGATFFFFRRSLFYRAYGVGG